MKFSQFLTSLILTLIASAAFAQESQMTYERVTLCSSGPVSVSISEDQENLNDDVTQIARKALITVDDKVAALFRSVNRMALPGSIVYSAGSGFSLKLDLTGETKKTLRKGVMLRSRGHLDADLPAELSDLKPFTEDMTCTRFWIH